ncbi:MAG: ATP-dependent Clp protease adaptor ClpS [Bacteroidales bacterium]|jgi:ATP-dependent Clp protease adaptor protein ClpS|nr:ATP-dependent Clp protease adaptor ClpS [Bacteroidales bacterium]MCK9449089.1 ATP-dependent Clp protease adaptor ClpS [Bacteroidales bacterium]MDD3700299.1 ATP-dependent Clp protease adaptor ClpS [Bacteroidales bacterium]MDY0368529.1 ATP-dependent Clp protease adaptor ClpS [Bacteroidales bacterium]
MVKEKQLHEVETDQLRKPMNKLILHNDDFNTFDYVIQALIEICDHSLEQAETCTMIAHYRGKCAIKSGVISELRAMHREFVLRQLTTTIE